MWLVVKWHENENRIKCTHEGGGGWANVKIEDKIVAMKLRDDKKNTKSHANPTIRHEIEMNSTENETHPAKTEANSNPK